MEFDEVLRSRRSIRAFTDREVPDRLVQTVIGAAMMAPSSMNGQPWRFIVVRDAGIKKELAQIKDRYCPPEKREYPAGFLRTAPVIVVTCVERARSFDRGMESGILATGQLLLAAAAQGLATVYLSAYKLGFPAVSADIRTLLEIPEEFDPVTIVPMGYPGAAAEPKEIGPAEEVIYRETFGRK